MVEIKGLNKFYGKFIALNNLDLHIDKGELFGFVGPNGAGKTTTMKILSGLLKASGGEAYVAGIDAIRQSTELKAMIGYMPDFFGVYDNLKAIEYMEFYASIYGMYGKQATSYCMELMDLVHLSDKANFYVDSLSRGMKQRLCLARSLVHNPQLLILDEPASGLNTQELDQLSQRVLRMRDMGITVVLIEHKMDVVMNISHKIMVLNFGECIAFGTPEEISADQQVIEAYLGKEDEEDA